MERVRQFAATRSQKMTATNTPREYPKQSVCVTCINKHLANSRNTMHKTRMETEAQQIKKQYQTLSKTDQAQMMRIKKNKSDMLYNMQQERVRKRENLAQKRQKIEARKLAQEQKQKEINQQKMKIKQKKDSQLIYRCQLYLQCRQLQEKRKQQKKKIQNGNILPSKKSLFSKKDYALDLQKQIQIDRFRKKQQRQQEKKVQQQATSIAEKEFLKYSEFSLTPRSSYNPQIFEEMLQIQAKKEFHKKQKRSQTNRNILFEITKDKQELKRQLTDRKNKQEEYHSSLDKQVKQKQKPRSEEIKTKEQLTSSYCGDAMQKVPTFGECEQCHIVCETKYLSPE